MKLILVKQRGLLLRLLNSAMLALVFLPSACSGEVPDVTAQLEVLGNPMAQDGKTGRALNVWDLQRFGGKIYVAGGSTVSNAGPINVWAYNPQKGAFQKEFTVREEAIEQFRVFGRSLYIPAADPRGGDAHKYYRRTRKQSWRLYQSQSPTLAHVRDLYKATTGEIWMVGNNRQAQRDPSRPAIAVTRDQGRSFHSAGLDKPPSAGTNWFFSIFSYRNQLYAPTALLRDAANRTGVIGVYNRQRQIFELSQTLKTDEFIPTIQLGPQVGPQGSEVIYRLWQPITYNDTLVYPVRSYSYSRSTYRSAYMNSLGFYVKTDMGMTPSRVVFPDGKSVGEDTLIWGDELYVLANAKISAEKFWVYVYKTTAPTQKWQAVLRFQSRNKARSFEYYDNAFYFGLGQDHEDLVGDSGTVLRVEL